MDYTHRRFIVIAGNHRVRALKRMWNEDHVSDFPNKNCSPITTTPTPTRLLLRLLLLPLVVVSSYPISLIPHVLQPKRISKFKNDVQLLDANPHIPTERDLIILSSMQFNSTDTDRDHDDIIDKVTQLLMLMERWWESPLHFKPPWDPNEAPPDPTKIKSNLVTAYRKRHKLANNMEKFAKWIGAEQAHALKIVDSPSLNSLGVLCRFANTTPSERLEFMQHAYQGKLPEVERLWELADFNLIEVLRDPEATPAEIAARKKKIRGMVFTSLTLLRVKVSVCIIHTYIYIYIYI